jgi:hypothetical protein
MIKITLKVYRSGTQVTLSPKGASPDIIGGPTMMIIIIVQQGSFFKL